MHPDDAVIQRLIDGELAAADAFAAREHIAGCAPCRQRFEAAAEDLAAVATLLGALDDPAPATALPDLAARARIRRVRWTRRVVAWAAAAAIAAVAVAAPDSPVRGWMADAVRWVRGASPPAMHAPPSGAAGAGIAVDPGSSFTIEIESTGANGSIDVRWADDGLLAVRSLYAGVGFTSDPERLRVAIDQPAVVLEVAVPRSAPRVEIRSGEQALWIAERGRVTSAAGPAPDGSYRIEFGGR